MKAKITRPDGTKIQITGKPSEVADVLAKLGHQATLSYVNPFYPWWTATAADTLEIAAGGIAFDTGMVGT